MKKVLKYIIVFIGGWALFELNSGKLLTDITGNAAMEPKETWDHYTDTVPIDYLQILHLKQEDCKYTRTSKFYLDKGIINNLRGPMCYFVYNKKYYLQIYSLSDSFTQPVDHTVKQRYVSADNSDSWSTLDNHSAVIYSYPVTLSHKFSGISLKLLGKDNRIILKNDSIAYYYSMFQKFAVQYDGSRQNEIYGESKDSNLFDADLLPIEILFLKRNNHLYLLTMSVYRDEEDNSYKPGMLYNLINSRK